MEERKPERETQRQKNPQVCMCGVWCGIWCVWACVQCDMCGRGVCNVHVSVCVGYAGARDWRSPLNCNQKEKRQLFTD